jgi:GDPmannose 4,6-dehydratase
MLDQFALLDILKKYRPKEIYNFAAYSSGSDMFENPIGIGEINGLSVVRLLEAIKEVDVNIRFCQASSREIFGDSAHSPQYETTVTNPRNPYGAAKLYADNMIKAYRKKYNLYVCSAILFNHESPRRGLGFVTRKITYEASRIKLGLTNELRLGNLDARRDWTFAGDTVNAMWLMLQADDADDYIIASGEAHSVREFCECAFSYLGLNYIDYVREDSSVYRMAEKSLLVGDAKKASKVLGWHPKIRFENLVHMMVDADMQKLKNT